MKLTDIQGHSGQICLNLKKAYFSLLWSYISLTFQDAKFIFAYVVGIANRKKKNQKKNLSGQNTGKHWINAALNHTEAKNKDAVLATVPSTSAYAV